jgi:hypothetical protein
MHGSANSISYSESKSPERAPSPTSESIANQSDALTYLEDQLRMLEQRLTPVLHPEPPVPTDANQRIEVGSDVALAAQIMEGTRRVGRVADGIGNLIIRLGI